MYFILLHHYADIVGSKFDFFDFFFTGLRMLLSGGQRWSNLTGYFN